MEPDISFDTSQYRYASFDAADGLGRCKYAADLSSKEHATNAFGEYRRKVMHLERLDPDRKLGSLGQSSFEGRPPMRAASATRDARAHTILRPDCAPRTFLASIDEELACMAELCLACLNDERAHIRLPARSARDFIPHSLFAKQPDKTTYQYHN